MVEPAQNISYSKPQLALIKRYICRKCIGLGLTFGKKTCKTCRGRGYIEHMSN